MLGEKHYEKYGLSLGFLVKLLDSSMRLHTQVHPTREFAKEKLNSNWGKLESYYVLKIRDNKEGHIRLGFQNPPTKSELKRIIEMQDIEKMDKLFEKVPIKQGDIVYIPGGIPHAIGNDILLVEIMEPSDLVIRCEFEREGVVLPEEGRFLGQDLEFCLDVFDYTKYSVADIKDKFFLEKEGVFENNHLTINRLIPASIGQTFEVFSFKISADYELQLDERFLVGLSVKGSVIIDNEDESILIEEGASFFIPSKSKSVQFKPLNGTEAELCVVTNVL